MVLIDVSGFRVANTHQHRRNLVIVIRDGWVWEELGPAGILAAIFSETTDLTAIYSFKKVSIFTFIRLKKCEIKHLFVQKKVPLHSKVA